MNIFSIWLRRRRFVICIFLSFAAIFFFTFALYHLPLQAVVYPAIICAFLGVLLLTVDYFRLRAKHRSLADVQKRTAATMGGFPPVRTIDDADYRAIIEALCDEQRAQATEASQRYTNMVEYYTVWAHQIKTPIASMRLRLQNEDSPFARSLSADLGRIEQYVEMVLVFLRLDSETTDYYIRECDLDDIVRRTVKKFSGDFIMRRLTLTYEPLNTRVITDEKWLVFVIEQIISNAIKYVREGGVSIYMEQPRTLCIRDTGIGIAPEDMPRIFEKGFTGTNGRADLKASGIGLYLCKRICDRLGHAIVIESQPDSGTTVRLELEQRALAVE